ncbi:MAG: hypothetical protein WBB46_12755 [Candidatus Deferrimicrobiaceae bacterium]
MNRIACMLAALVLLGAVGASNAQVLDKKVLSLEAARKVSAWVTSQRSPLWSTMKIFSFSLITGAACANVASTIPIMAAIATATMNRPVSI